MADEEYQGLLRIEGRIVQEIHPTWSDYAGEGSWKPDTYEFDPEPEIVHDEGGNYILIVHMGRYTLRIISPELSDFTRLAGFITKEVKRVRASERRTVKAAIRRDDDPITAEIVD
jgi:hypothetical protein